MKSRTTQQHWLRLHLTPGLGRVGIMRLMETYADPASALARTRDQWRADANLTSMRIKQPPATDAEIFVNACHLLEQYKVHIISLWDDDYPALLRNIADPPALLYVRGNIDARPAIAIVGSRRASRDSLRLAHEVAATLARHNIAVVSGLARGIDTAAHTGAIAGGGTTVAVLGGGIDCIYPPENRRLFEQIAASGAVISEYPPFTPPMAGHFPARNRIISGLCGGTFVVEAAENSGSLLTASFAAEQGRDVYAAPGPVYAPGCKGNLELLKQGATLVTEAADILGGYAINHPLSSKADSREIDLSGLSDTQKQIFNLLTPTPLHLDQLADRSGLTPMEVSAIVLHLELQGFASALPGGRYVRGSAG